MPKPWLAISLVAFACGAPGQRVEPSRVAAVAPPTPSAAPPTEPDAPPRCALELGDETPHFTTNPRFVTLGAKLDGRRLQLIIELAEPPVLRRAVEGLHVDVIGNESLLIRRLEGFSVLDLATGATRLMHATGTATLDTEGHIVVVGKDVDSVITWLDALTLAAVPVPASAQADAGSCPIATRDGHTAAYARYPDSQVVFLDASGAPMWRVPVARPVGDAAPTLRWTKDERRVLYATVPGALATLDPKRRTIRWVRRPKQPSESTRVVDRLAYTADGKWLCTETSMFGRFTESTCPWMVRGDSFAPAPRTPKDVVTPIVLAGDASARLERPLNVAGGRRVVMPTFSVLGAVGPWALSTDGKLFALIEAQRGPSTPDGPAADNTLAGSVHLVVADATTGATMSDVELASTYQGGPSFAIDFPPHDSEHILVSRGLSAIVAWKTGHVVAKAEGDPSADGKWLSLGDGALLRISTGDVLHPKEVVARACCDSAQGLPAGACPGR